MNLKQVKEKAKAMGIKPSKMRKAELIHAIQKAEGNAACYETADVITCDQNGCCWKTSCQKSAPNN